MQWGKHIWLSWIWCIRETLPVLADPGACACVQVMQEVQQGASVV